MSLMMTSNSQIHSYQFGENLATPNTQLVQDNALRTQLGSAVKTENSVSPFEENKEPLD